MTDRRRQTTRSAMAVVALSVMAACRQAPAPSPPRLPPLGPGVTIALAVKGSAALAPVVSAQSPFVAVAFAAADQGGAARVYLATSADNGATFTEPSPVPDEGPGGAYDDLGVVVQTGTQTGEGEPSVTVQWRRADGQTASRALRPWRGALSGTQAFGAAARGAAVASCEDDGEVLLVAGFKGPGPVSVNHALKDQHCAPGSATALVDARAWVHAAWVGGRDDASRRVFYTASPDRDWFGGAHALVDAGQAPSHVRITTDPNDTIVAVWDTADGATRQVVLRQILPAHHGPPTVLPLTHLSAGDGGVEPSVASIDGGVIVGWRVPATGAVALRRVGLDAICDATAIAATPAPRTPGDPR